MIPTLKLNTFKEDDKDLELSQLEKLLLKFLNDESEFYKLSKNATTMHT